MFILLQTQFGFISPAQGLLFTKSYPQIDKVWFNSQPSLFRDNIAGPYMEQRYNQNSNISIGIVTSSKDYFDVFMAFIQQFSYEYKQVVPIIIDEKITQIEYFQKLKDLEIYKLDYIIMPLINVDNQLDDNHDESLKLFMNDYFYQKKYTQLYFQSIEQVQQSYLGYQNLMKINTSVLNEKYFNFTESIIQLPDTIFITTSSDQINSLYISSLQACPISPNGEMQTSSSTCQISVPIGMTTKGINGRGNIGQSVGILATMLFMTTSNNRTFYDKKFVIQQATLIKKQPLSYQQQQYIEGYGFGFTDYKAINLANSHYYQQNKQTQLSLLVKGNIKNGDILNIGSFQLIKIQVTLRGNQDLFEENYENIASTHMQSNTGQEALKYNDISVWIILLDGTEQIPHYIGTYFIEQANQKSTLNYILDQSNFNGFYVQDYIQVLFSYSKTRSQVIQEIKDKTQINTDLIVSLQIFGVKKNIQFTIFNAHQKLYQRNNIYFISNVSYHYMICHYGRNLLFRQLDVQTENNIKKVKLDTLGLCALVLCETEQMKNHLIQQSPFCTSSNEIIVEDFIIAITFSTLIYIITFLLLLTILPVFLYSKVNSNDDSDQSS